jgi:hypothetical protein
MGYTGDHPTIRALSQLIQNNSRLFKAAGVTLQRVKAVFEERIAWPKSPSSINAMVGSRAANIHNIVKSGRATDRATGRLIPLGRLGGLQARVAGMYRDFTQDRVRTLARQHKEREEAQARLRRNADQQKRAQQSTTPGVREEQSKRLQQENAALRAQVAQLDKEIALTKLRGLFRPKPRGPLNIAGRGISLKGGMPRGPGSSPLDGLKNLGNTPGTGPLEVDLGGNSPSAGADAPRKSGPENDHTDQTSGVDAAVEEEITLDPIDPEKVAQDADKKAKRKKAVVIAGVSLGGAAAAAALLVKVL